MTNGTFGRGEWMPDRAYVRPVGLFVTGEEQEELWGGLPLGGTSFAFGGVEVIERTAAGTTRRRVTLGELYQSDQGRDIEILSTALDRMSLRRHSIAGLALDRPRIMGIVNVTPDSFSDGGRHTTTDAAVAHGLRLVEEGAEILDVGAESTRPGSEAVPVEEELARLLPVIEGLRARTAVPISVDTRKAEVMRRAAAAGASIINDVSALTYDPAAMEAAAASGLPVVLMHALGDPKTMQDDPRYDDVLLDVYDFLEARIAACEAAGIALERLVADPGIGFGKTVGHNLALMAGLSIFHGLGVPVLLGASRKRFIGAMTGQPVAADRVAGSVGAALAAAGQGTQILRVHDVAATRQALDVWMASVMGAIGNRQ